MKGKDAGKPPLEAALNDPDFDLRSYLENEVLAAARAADQAIMRNNLLSDIEDYCFLFGTDALPALRDYLAQATTGWTKRPDLALVETDG